MDTMETMSRRVGRYSDGWDTMETDSLDALIRSAEAFLRATASHSGAEIERARARVKSELEAARQHMAEESGKHYYRRAKRAAQDTGRYVAEHKWQAVRTATLVGALAGGIYAGIRWAAKHRS